MWNIILSIIQYNIVIAQGKNDTNFVNKTAESEKRHFCVADNKCEQLLVYGVQPVYEQQNITENTVKKDNHKNTAERYNLNFKMIFCIIEIKIICRKSIEKKKQNKDNFSQKKMILEAIYQIPYKL